MSNKNEPSLFRKRVTKIFLIGACLFLTAGGFYFTRRNCDTISYPERSGVLDDRRPVVVVEDYEVFDRASTKDIALSTFSGESVSKIIFCEDVHRHSLKESYGSTVLLFGNKYGQVDAFESRDSFVYLVFPTAGPPSREIPSVQAVVLNTADSGSYNQQWKAWCAARRVPCVQVIGKSVTSAVRGLLIAQELLLNEQERSENKPKV